MRLFGNAPRWYINLIRSPRPVTTPRAPVCHQCIVPDAVATGIDALRAQDRAAERQRRADAARRGWERRQAPVRAMTARLRAELGLV